jgi:Dolichyl-phosphate-mannose-protein mannosyltransferase
VTVGRERLVVAGVGVAAFALRMPGALRDAFWQDEVSSARIVRVASPVASLRQVARGEATPPLWYLVGWLAHAVGIAPGGYRWVSVLCGALAAAAVVVLARLVLPLWAAAFAGLLAAAGWELVMHGRELRAYAAFELLAALLPLALLRAVGNGDGRSLALLAVVVGAGTMTSYFFALGVVGAVVWLWWQRREVARRTTLWIALGLVPLLLWSPALVHQYRGQRFAWIGPFSLRRLLDTPWLLFVHHVPHGALGTVAPILFALVLVAGAAILASLTAEARLYASLLVVPFALIVVAWIGGAHVFVSRNLIGVAPFAAIACAALAARVPRPAAPVLAAAALAAVVLGAARAETTPPPRYDDVAGALVAAGWRPADPIVLLGNFFAFRSPLEWYLPHEPHLTLGLPGGDCAAVYVVAQGPRNRARAAALAGSTRDVGGIAVARLRAARVPARTQAFATASARCVRLVPESRLVAELRHLRGSSA